MPVDENGRAIYPSQGWSTGTMRKARMDKLPDQPTQEEQARGKGSLDYDVLHQQIGPEGTAFIKRFDTEAQRPTADPALKQNWKSWRQYWIDRYGEGQGPSTPTPGTQQPTPGSSSPFRTQI
jgi:hypothetical protein